MKRIKILVCGFGLAIALVVLPFPYIEDITSGLGFSIAAVLFAWLGILERKGSKDDYKRDVQLYSARTMMKVVHVEESEYERWEDQPDGSLKLCCEKAYLPTYEYSVNGKTYRYHSFQSVSGKRDVGKQVVGYYKPDQPDLITENRPRRPVFGGFIYFYGAAICLFFGIMTFTGM